MKKSFLIFTILSAVLASCLNADYKDDIDCMLTTSKQVSNSFVSKDQIESAIDKFFPVTKSGERLECSIDPLTSSTGDTLMYIINTGGRGWKILSADTRTPPILAEGDNGAFAKEDGNGGLVAWIDRMKTDMTAVRNASDNQLTFSEEEITANKAFWSGETPRIELPPETPWPGGGHWISTLLAEEEITISEIGHMTPHWDQSEPYNCYCPLKSWSETIHKPAGCVSVAGANVLYYLQSKLGTLKGSPGSCTYDDGRPHFADYSVANWSLMDTSSHAASIPAEKEALLIAHVGDLVNMSYSDTSSSAFFYKLRTDAFPEYNISCNQRSYSQDSVKLYLERGYPIIVSASDQLIPANGRIHCFVIDGYRKTKKKYTYYNEFISSNPDIQAPEGYFTYSYSSPEITCIKINWGWKSQWNAYMPLNDGWFTLTANWVVTNGETYSYNHNVSMIYNFTPIPVY